MALKTKLKKFIDKLFDSWISTVGFLKDYKLKKGDIVIDAGAYFGYFTIFASKKVGRDGKIIAFEPDPRNYRILQANLNSANLNNVIVIKKALFNKNGKISLNSAFSASRVLENKEADGGLEVSCTTLDSELEKLGIEKVNFIKMDIEGAELEAIAGAKKTLANTPHLAIACYHKRGGKTTGRILQPLLEQMGFKTRIGFFLHPTLYGTKLKI